MATLKAHIIETTEKWLVDFIVKLNICPFAKTPYEENRVRLEVSLCEEFEERLLFFEEELLKVSKGERLTSLVILPNSEEEFEDFLDFTAACEALCEDLGLAQDFQLVAFHPEFKFDGLDVSDRANWVNRSPYPLIHILSMDEISAVMSDPKEGEKISLRNEEKLNSLSPDQWKLIQKLLGS